MDRRTKRQKLEAMANQVVSPNEAEIAKKKLEELEPDPQVDFINFSFNIGPNVGPQPSGYSTGFVYKTVSMTMNFYDIFGTSRTYTVSTKK